MTAQADDPPAVVSPKENAYQLLKDWIIYSRLKPGTPLNERELAERFGISRTPLREVLQRLGYQRLIITRPRKGIFVAPIDFFTIRDIFEARLPLERSIAALASQRATPQQVDELSRLVDTMREYGEQDDISGLIRLDQQFHETLAEATGNRVMREIAEDLHNVCLRFWNLSSEARDHDYEGVEELAQVVAALRAADADFAARVMGVHVLAFLTIFDEASANMLQKLPLDEGDLRQES